MKSVRSLRRREALGVIGGAAAVLACPGRVSAAEPLVLGRTVTRQGILGYVAAALDAGIQAAFDEANERGGIGGRRLSLVTLDDEGSVDKATENARLLVQRERVFSFFACTGTVSVSGTLPVVRQQQVPLVAPGTGLDMLRAYDPLVFHTRASYGAEVARIVQQMASTGQNRCAVIYNDNALGRSLLANFDAAAGRVAGFEWKAFLLPDSREAIGQVIQEVLAWRPPRASR